MKWVLLDLDGVAYFVRPNNKIRFDLLSKLAEKHSKALDLGRVSFIPVLQEYNKMTGQKFTEESFFKAYHENVEINWPLINKLSMEGYSIAILSNNYAENIKYLRKKLQQQTWATKEIYSYALGVAKPDKKIFMQALKIINAKPKDCLFLDNDAENVKAAKKLGIEAKKYPEDYKI